MGETFFLQKLRLHKGSTVRLLKEISLAPKGKGDRFFKRSIFSVGRTGCIIFGEGVNFDSWTDSF